MPFGKMIACAFVIPRTLSPFLFVLIISKSVFKDNFTYRFAFQGFIFWKQGTEEQLCFARYSSNREIINEDALGK